MTKSSGLAVPLLILLLACLVVPLFGDDPVPALDETLRLRAENQKLKEELLQVRYQLTTCDAQRQAALLLSSRQALERLLLAGAPSGATFDWSQLAVVAPPQKDAK